MLKLSTNLGLLYAYKLLIIIFQINYAECDFKSKRHRAHNDTTLIKASLTQQCFMKYIQNDHVNIE